MDYASTFVEIQFCTFKIHDYNSRYQIVRRAGYLPSIQRSCLAPASCKLRLACWSTTHQTRPLTCPAILDGHGGNWTLQDLIPPPTCRLMSHFYVQLWPDKSRYPVDFIQFSASSSQRLALNPGGLIPQPQPQPHKQPMRGIRNKRPTPFKNNPDLIGVGFDIILHPRFTSFNLPDIPQTLWPLLIQRHS